MANLMDTQRNDANILLMRMKESPDMWQQAGTILEQSQSQHTRFIGLQVSRKDNRKPVIAVIAGATESRKMAKKFRVKTGVLHVESKSSASRTPWSRFGIKFGPRQAGGD